jgi:hypothetical protein
LLVPCKPVNASWERTFSPNVTGTAPYSPESGEIPSLRFYFGQIPANFRRVTPILTDSRKFLPQRDSPEIWSSAVAAMVDSAQI